MKNFATSFSSFYFYEYHKFVRYPTAKALFQREVNLLFDAFRKWLANKFKSHKGLTKKVFISLLENKGHIIVTSKK